MTRLLTVVAALALAGATIPALAAGGNIAFVNQTERGIDFLGVFPTGGDNRADNALGASLAHGDSATIAYDEGAGCRFDIRVIFTEYENDFYLENLDLCAIRSLSLTYDAANRIARFATE